MPFEEALQKLGSRSAIASTLSSSEWRDVPVALRERAFFSSRVESVRFLQRAQDSITDFLTGAQETLPNGQTLLKTGSRAAFVDQMQKFLQAEGVQRGAGGLRDLTSSPRLGLIFDTQVKQANGYGYWRQGMTPAVLNMFPAMRFIRVQAVKEPRTSHSRYVGQVYLKTDPIWALVINEDFHVPWGPWAWGCGHDVEDVDRREAETLRLIKRGERLTPDKKHFNENLQASTKGLAPELLEKLKKEFGDRIVIEGDTIRWKHDAAVTPAPAAPEPAPVATPAPATPAAGTSAPVSDALNVKSRGTTRNAIKTALEAIDQVHSDGVLPVIPLTGRSGDSSVYGYHRRKVGSDGLIISKEINVNPRGRWPALTAVHEVGHFLDLSGIGPRGSYATEAFPLMQEVLAAADTTESIKGLRLQYGSYDYPLYPKEIWARAYAQYIAEESGNAMLLADLAEARAADPLRQWSKEDFAPLSRAITKMFATLGWL